MKAWMAFLREQEAALVQHVAEHLLLAGLATLMALVIGVTLAAFSFHSRRLRATLLVIVNILQTIPGLALLVIMLALLGRIGTLPALAALVLYALLPIMRNTLAGLASVPPHLAEAAQAMGMTRRQRMLYVRLPTAMPMIIAGLRTAAVQAVGLATLAAFVGAGGLGQFINRGLFLSDTRLILLGAIPAAMIALLIDALISLLQYGWFDRDAPRLNRRMALFSGSALLFAMFFFALTFLPAAGNKSGNQAVIIGSKNFTEQLIVAEIVAQTIEQQAHLPVIRRFGLGGTAVMHEALKSGEIDLAVEYTGTALTHVLGEPAQSDPRQVFAIVARDYERRFQLRWLPPLGFNNAYLLAVRHNDPRLKNVATLSQLVKVAPQLHASFDFEFAERPDGYAGLIRTYGLRFKRVRDMHPDLLYSVLENGQADVISAYATDGRLVEPGFTTLRDDKRFFPPYEAAIVVREEALKRRPVLAKALQSLSGRFNDAVMRELNSRVDKGELSPEEAAALFLNENPINP